MRVRVNQFHVAKRRLQPGEVIDGVELGDSLPSLIRLGIVTPLPAPKPRKAQSLGDQRSD